MAPLDWAKEAFEKVNMLNTGKITGLHQITRSNLQNVEIEYNDDAANQS